MKRFGFLLFLFTIFNLNLVSQDFITICDKHIRSNYQVDTVMHQVSIFDFRQVILEELPEGEDKFSDIYTYILNDSISIKLESSTTSKRSELTEIVEYNNDTIQYKQTQAVDHYPVWGVFDQMVTTLSCIDENNKEYLERYYLANQRITFKSPKMPNYREDSDSIVRICQYWDVDRDGTFDLEVLGSKKVEGIFTSFNEEDLTMNDISLPYDISLLDFVVLPKINNWKDLALTPQ